MVSIRKWLSLVLYVMLVGALLAACSSDKGGSTTTENPPPSNEQTDTNTPDDSKKTDNPPAAEDGPVDGGTLTFSSFSDIVTINPIFINDTASSDAAHFLLAKVYDLAPDGQIIVEPWSLAAELPEISEDSKTYTVKLKPEAKWTDGTPVTADDLIYTIETIKNEDTGSPARSAMEKVAKTEKVDDHTVKITLSEVFAPFQYSLVTELAPAHILKDVPVKKLLDHEYGKDPAKTVTNGPWKWTEWQKTQHLTFEKDPNYWGATKPHIDKIIYKIYADQNTEVQALLKGDTDHTSAIPVVQVEAVKKNSSITLIQEPGPSYEFIGFNFKEDNFPDKFVPFATQKTRQAIAYALNRQGMVDNVLKGTGVLMNSPFLPGSWADPGDNAVNYEYNPEKAKQLLAEDGWVLNEKTGILEKDGKKFSFELEYNAGNSRREAIAQVIQSNLKEVGIEVIPKAIDFSIWVPQHLNVGKYQTILLGWSLEDPDPNADSIFSSKFFPPAGQNMGWYKNEKLDQLWVDGYSTIDQEERKKVYAEVGKEISTDLPYIFLYRYGNATGIGPRVAYAEEDAPVPTLPKGYFYHVIKWWVKS